MEQKRFAILGFLIFLLLSARVYAEPEQKIKVQVSILFVNSDGDGISDEMEKDVHHTKPDNPDSDSDGYSDGTEVLYGGDPLESSVIPTKGDLHVTSNPTNATIFLEGNWGYLGRFGGFSDVVISKLDVGRHLLRLSHPGYEDSYDAVQVSPPKNLRDVSKAHVELKPLTRPDYGEGGRLTSGGLPIDVGDSAIPVVCDWDNDGKKDLLVGNSTGALILYRNTGSDASPDFTESIPLISNDAFLAPFVVDWDNDGKKDLLIGTRDGNVLFFRNTGSDDIPSIVSNGIPQVTALPGGYARPLAVDWNGDTKKDLLVGDGSGKINAFLNTGSDDQPTFDAPPFTALSFEPGRISPFVVTDWDGDSKKDILVGTSDGRILLYSHQGDNAFSGPIPIQSGLAGAKQEINTGAYASPFVADLNHDGMKDLLIGNENGEILYYGNHPPVASFIAADMVIEGEQVSFNGSSSFDPDGDPLKYRWSFGDGTTDVEEGPNTQHTFDDEGIYRVTLTVTDSYGVSHSTQMDVRVANVAPLVLGGPDQRVVAGDTVSFSGVYLDPGMKDTHSILWDFGDGTTAAGQLTLTHVYIAGGDYTVTLVVTDNAMETGSDKVTVRVDEAGTTRPFSLAYPLNGMVFSTASVNLSGLLNIPADGVTVKVNGTPVIMTLHSDSSFDGAIPLVFGPNTIDITLTDEDGYLSTKMIEVNRSGGDLNGDGIVGVEDAFTVLQISSGAETPESLGLRPDQMDFAPLHVDSSGNVLKNPDGSVIPDPNGVINVADALILLRAALGTIILPLSP
ncbi:MAG: PKD domain-containing protein [Thermodesulfobacteriota bacterium]|nr:PKD domain-containing protein [Thermodesulfobacteriota bacterium]